jgi:hypothetical protein
MGTPIADPPRRWVATIFSALAAHDVVEVERKEPGMLWINLGLTENSPVESIFYQRILVY